MSKTVAELPISRLSKWGVDTIFGFPGDGVNRIFEAVRTNPEKLHFIQVRHEEAAAFAACGYAKYTGRLGVCLATSGPGGIHLLNGLYDASCDGQPVLAITGHTFHDLIGTCEAMKTALSRRSVAHITIPKDVQDWTSSDAERSDGNIPQHSSQIYASAYSLPHTELLQQAAEIINEGEKIVILAGDVCTRTRGVAITSYKSRTAAT